MRARSILALLTCVLGACVPTPPVTVVHVSKSQPASPDDKAGDGLKMRRPGNETYSSIHGGAYVVRTRTDWEKMWSGKDDVPSIPEGIDLQREMLLVVATDDAIVSKLEISRVAEASGNVTVWVKQTMLGEGCVRNKYDDRSGLDAIVTARIDKPIKFVVEDEDAPSCGAPPKADVSCRVGAGKTWTPKVTAKAGEIVECELASIATGKYTLVDQVLSLGDVPPASKAKLTFSKGSVRAKLSPDVFGTYAIKAEATDEAGRKGFGTATIDVLPKKTRDVQIQLAWSDTESLDPATPLPRVLLRVATEGAKGQRCSAEVPVPGLCDAKTRGSFTYMKIPGGWRRKLPLSLLYLDERAQSGASPCVHVWFNGERTTSVCDHDHRHAEDKWELGSIDTGTGKIAPPKPPKPPKPAKPTTPPKPPR
ncbi:MAG: hypothetical protein KIT84_05870 [Labilithrix sp.]|nr:hypothetical protein [Labilithrix sp.]MCW5810517.1 hypothetical protein [Labilithrix sp.]